MGLARKKLGKTGEKAAGKHLIRNGYKILARNYSRAGGEVDLICYHEGCIVFVEVKTRSDPLAFESDPFVAPGQWRHAERAALAWLAEHREPNCAYRFDALSVVLPPDGNPRVRHVVDAFVPSR